MNSGPRTPTRQPGRVGRRPFPSPTTGRGSPPRGRHVPGGRPGGGGTGASRPRRRVEVPRATPSPSQGVPLTPGSATVTTGSFASLTPAGHPTPTPARPRPTRLRASAGARGAGPPTATPTRAGRGGRRRPPASAAVPRAGRPTAIPSPTRASARPGTRGASLTPIA